ncbi:MAG: acyl-CoA synthetase [Caulobacter sp.]|nr:acyl-CoA synthetase [Caulobacter sp.]
MSTIWSGDRQRTQGEIQQRSLQAATGLESLGVGAGDTVALYLRNDFAFFEAGGAIGALGAYPVAVNWHYTVDEARYLLEDSAAKVLIIHADLLGLIRAAAPASVQILVVPTPPEIREAYGVSDADAAVPEGLTDWDTFVSSFPPRTEEPRPAPGAIIYTSGTTGRPKGVRRPAATPERGALVMEMLCRSYGFLDYLANPDEIVTVVAGPIYHAAPNAHAGVAFRIGANLTLLPRFDPEEFLALIEKRRVTHLNMVPIMFNRLLKLPAEVRAKYDVSSLKFVTHAAAPVSPPIKRAMIDWWGPVIWEYYGSTEMGNVTICNAEEWLAHPGTVGKLMPGATVRVIDAEGNDLPAGEIGEVIGRFHGSGDFTYQNDEAKRRSMEKDGLITPGDVGYFDKDGFLYLCDRKSDMIISGGVNIYPAEVEAQLHRMPGVADCAVFGIPDDDFGEAVCAVVQAQPGVELTEAEVRGWLREQMAGYKVPKRVDFLAELPREDSGKIFKRKIRQTYWEGAGRTI